LHVCSGVRCQLNDRICMDAFGSIETPTQLSTSSNRQLPDLIIPVWNVSSEKARMSGRDESRSPLTGRRVVDNRC
jgi:hypothetical protein